MPHISKKYPAVGHGEKGGDKLVRVGAAVDRVFRSNPRASAYINFGDEKSLAGESRKNQTTTKSSICEEAGDCADRVNEEDLSPEAKQILRDAERVA